MRMPLDSILILGINPRDGSLDVVCDFGSLGLVWPPYLHHKGQEYKFSSNEAMEHHMANDYAGRAKYEPIK